MNNIIGFLLNPYTQIVLWICVVSLTYYFSQGFKKLSFGKDMGTTGWILISIAFALIGLGEVLKTIPYTSSSYALQVIIYLLGIVGIVTLIVGIGSYWFTLRRTYGVWD